MDAGETLRKSGTPQYKFDLDERLDDDAFVEARRDRGTYRNCSKAGVSLREIESLATRTVERLHTRVALGFQFVIFREIQEGNFP